DLTADQINQPHKVCAAGSRLCHEIVEILDRNCNYFVAQSGASSADFMRLVDLVRRQVEDRLDIKLALAIQVW
ncbi:MAG: hypothetical protein ACKO0N_02090, partial [Planctomycetota bacterium]